MEHNCTNKFGLRPSKQTTKYRMLDKDYCDYQLNQHKTSTTTTTTTTTTTITTTVITLDNVIDDNYHDNHGN